MSFIGSSDRWGDESCARLCEIIMDANDGLAQQIIENRTDLLDLKTKEELDVVDEFGLTLPFLAVYNDRPDMIRYLAARGLDMTKTCDTMGFGNPMFYAVNLGKLEVIKALHSVGCSVTRDCDTFLNFKPEYYASRIDNQEIKDNINHIKSSEVRAANLFKRNYLRYKWRKLYTRKINGLVCIQRYVRGFIVRSVHNRRLREQPSSSEGTDGTTSVASSIKLRINTNTSNNVSGGNSHAEGDEDENESHSEEGGEGLDAKSSVFSAAF
jgi:hypothetical protein